MPVIKRSISRESHPLIGQTTLELSPDALTVDDSEYVAPTVSVQRTSNELDFLKRHQRWKKEQSKFVAKYLLDSEISDHLRDEFTTKREVMNSIAEVGKPTPRQINYFLSLHCEMEEYFLEIKKVRRRG